MRVSVTLLLLSLSLLGLGCARPPQQELAEASAKMEEHRLAGTNTIEMEAAFAAVTAEVGAQNTKFALLRSYSKAKELLYQFELAVASPGTGASGVSQPPPEVSSAQFNVWVDEHTGCQYLHAYGAITPRLGRDGSPICGGGR